MLVLVLLTGLDWSSAILKLPTNAVRVGPWERSEESGSKPTEEGGGDLRAWPPRKGKSQHTETTTSGGKVPLHQRRFPSWSTEATSPIFLIFPTAAHRTYYPPPTAQAKMVVLG